MAKLLRSQLQTLSVFVPFTIKALVVIHCVAFMYKYIFTQFILIISAQ